MSDWRYSVQHDTVNNHTTITRGRTYRVSDTGADTSEDWTHYMSGEEAVAFYDEGFRGRRVVSETNFEDGERAIIAFDHERIGAPGGEGALKRLAVRLTENPDADFIVVHLDRGMDLYALSWDGDPDRTWRDEIEAVWNGEVYRCEVEEYTLMGVDANGEHWEWTPADDMCEEWYGEDNADAGLAEAFPETEFPADKIIPNTGD